MIVHVHVDVQQLHVFMQVLRGMCCACFFVMEERRFGTFPDHARTDATQIKEPLRVHK